MTDTPKEAPEELAENDDDWHLYDAREQSKELQALFCNRAFVQPDGLHLRISLGEQVGDDAKYRIAIVVPNGSALELGQLITRMAQSAINAQIDQINQLVERGELPKTQPQSDV